MHNLSGSQNRINSVNFEPRCNRCSIQEVIAVVFFELATQRVSLVCVRAPACEVFTATRQPLLMVTLREAYACTRAIYARTHA